MHHVEFIKNPENIPLFVPFSLASISFFMIERRQFDPKKNEDAKRTKKRLCVLCVFV